MLKPPIRTYHIRGPRLTHGRDSLAAVADDHQGRREGVLLTDAEANEIRLGLALGVRGPVLIKWCGPLLADRDERRAREGAFMRRWPGPLAGPHVAVQARCPMGKS